MYNMKGNQAKRGVRSKDSGKTCTPVVIATWALVLGWMIFLSLYWNSNVFSRERMPKLSVVDDLMNKTEHTLRLKLKNLRNDLHFLKQHSNNDKLDTVLDHIEVNLEKNNEIEPVSKSISNENEEDPDLNLHIIFSTDCSGYQNWQALTIFHSAKVVGQKGTITRIASGCDEKKKQEIKDLYTQLYPEYHVHFTPDFMKDEKTGKKYEFYNKPFGLLDWLDNATPPIANGVIIALIDPDMIFLRPLTTRIKGESNLLYTSGIKPEEIIDRVKKGSPAAQQYGLGAPWTFTGHRNFDKFKVCGDNSPCTKMDHSFGAKWFSVGPPLLVEKDDLHRIAKTWCDFVPRVYDKYPELLAEMYAYSMAAAHENLPHLQLDHYMVSNMDASGEGWDWVDKLEDTCLPPVNGIFYPNHQLPTLLHFCSFPRVGNYGFQKRRVPHNSFSCEAPMLVEPPEGLGSLDYKVTDDHGKKVIGKQAGRRHAFMLCALHRSINAALTDFKQRMCKDNPKTNYEKKLNLLWDWP